MAPQLELMHASDICCNTELKAALQLMRFLQKPIYAHLAVTILYRQNCKLACEAVITLITNTWFS